ncbi:phage holin family protein [Bryobacter aggregatus]|uniref:phage holin family protein n=1 Tax=Bryobacter aggregatus TaxID=360054 RepID=UPI0004E0E3B7|nr:phage holin family protein [Bryobacter aggregatus]
MSLILKWIVSAIALYVVTQFIPGVHVSTVPTILLAALVIGLVNATLGNILKLLTLPIGCLTLGLSSLIINALMFLLAAKFVSGFRVDGFVPALLGSLVMSLVSGLFHLLLGQIFSETK